MLHTLSITSQLFISYNQYKEKKESEEKTYLRHRLKVTLL